MTAVAALVPMSLVSLVDGPRVVVDRPRVVVDWARVVVDRVVDVVHGVPAMAVATFATLVALGGFSGRQKQQQRAEEHCLRTAEDSVRRQKPTFYPQ